MADKRWQNEVLRETPTLNLLSSILITNNGEKPRDVLVSWMVLHITALNVFGGNNMSDESVAMVASEILTAFPHWTITQFVAFPQWYKQNGDNFVSAMNLMKGANKFQQAFGEIVYLRKKELGESEEYVIRYPRELTPFDIKMMENQELDERFCTILANIGGKLVGVETGDWHMIVMEYYRRHCMPSLTKYFDGWEMKMVNHINGICDYNQTDCIDIVRLADIDTVNQGNFKITKTTSRL